MKVITTREVTSLFGIKRPALALKREGIWNKTLKEITHAPKGVAYQWFSTAVSTDRWGHTIEGTERPITKDEELEQFKGFRQVMEILNKGEPEDFRNYGDEKLGIGTISFFLCLISAVHGAVNLSLTSFGLSLLFGGLGYAFFKWADKDYGKLFEDLHYIYCSMFRDDIIGYYFDREVPKEFFEIDAEMAEHLMDEISNLKEHFDEHPECRRCWGIGASED